MLTTQIQNEPEAQIPYQQQPWGMPEPGAPPPSPMPPPLAPVSPKRRGTVRTGALVALTLLLAVIFGVGLFAGWQFSKTSTSTAQTTSTVQATSTVATAQEVAIAKVKAAVVEVAVTTQNASAIGSGVIIDQRGRSFLLRPCPSMMKRAIA